MIERMFTVRKCSRPVPRSVPAIRAQITVVTRSQPRLIDRPTVPTYIALRRQYREGYL
jgi:hypothetical protein